MRPVNKGTRPSSYSPQNTLRFNGSNATIVHSFLNTNNPTLNACLNLWLRAVRARYSSSKPRNYKALSKAAKIIEKKISAIYKAAASSLLLRLGEHCSYCGEFLSTTVEVEHVLPKSEYPTFSTDWDNFLLSCGPCNNKKKATPDRTEVRNWLGHDINSENDCLREIRDNHYVWPDIEPRSHRLFQLKMEHLEIQTGNWRPVPTQAASDLNNKLLRTDISSLSVYANIGSIPGNVSVRVIVEPDASYANQVSISSTRARDMIDLCDLNQVKPSSASYDRRVFHRTLAWFTVLETLNNLRNNPPAYFNSNWTAVGSIAKSTGFFNVWFTLLTNETDPQGNNLASLFVRDFSNHFPNTNPANFP